MKPKPDLDPDFAADSRWWSVWVRAIGLRTLVIALAGSILCGLTLACRVSAMAGDAVAQTNGRVVVLQKPGQAPRAKALTRSPRDRFVVMARANIDPEMIVPAPAGIDEAMVFTEDEGRLVRWTVVAPRPGVPAVAVPGYLPIPQPRTGDPPPPEYFPRLPAPSQPR